MQLTAEQLKVRMAGPPLAPPIAWILRHVASASHMRLDAPTTDFSQATVKCLRRARFPEEACWEHATREICSIKGQLGARLLIHCCARCREASGRCWQWTPTLASWCSARRAPGRRRRASRGTRARSPRSCPSAPARKSGSCPSPSERAWPPAHLSPHIERELKRSRFGPSSCRSQTLLCSSLKAMMQCWPLQSVGLSVDLMPKEDSRCPVSISYWPLM